VVAMVALDWVALVDTDLIGGIAVLTAWAVAVLWGAGTDRSVGKKGAPVGAGLPCRLGRRLRLDCGNDAGDQNSLPFDTFGLGFLLVVGSGLAIWAFGHRP
jgi:hypothetical protein